MSAPAAYLFDLEGTLYEGETAVPGATAALARLRAAGVPYRLVTNTTSRSRAMLVARLQGLGFTVSAAEIFSPAVAAAELGRARGHTVVAAFVPRAALVDLQPLTTVGGTSGAPVGAPPTAVLVGDLGEAWTFALLQEAFTYLMAGAELIALSRDRYFRRADGIALDAGPFVVALEYAASITATVAGKPSADFFRAAVASLGVAGGARVVMVGDDLWTDVQGAQRAGLEGWLVRTGKFRADTLAASDVVPHRILGSVAEI